MPRACWWGHAVRLLAAVAVGAAVFEGLDALAVRVPAASWLTLASPVLAGGVAAWCAGGGMRRRLLASAAVAWARIAADRAVGLAHGVRQPLEVEVAVAAVFGIPWMMLAAVGGFMAAVVRPRARSPRPRRDHGNSPRVT